MPSHPAFNGKTINKPGGGDGEIDRRAVLITQPTEAHFTGSVLYAHLCLWNCNRLFQLHAQLDHGVVTIDVLLWVTLWKKKNHFSCKWCKKKFYFEYFFSSYPTVIFKTAIIQPLHETTDVNTEADQTTKTLFWLSSRHKLWAVTIRKDHGWKRLKLGFSGGWPPSFSMTESGAQWSENTLESNHYLFTLKAAT